MAKGLDQAGFLKSAMSGRVPEPEVWTARLRDFVQDCLASTPSDEADRVREAAFLLREGAVPDSRLDCVDPEDVEVMLACGAVESAALSLLSPGAVFMLSRGQDNSCLATVIAGEGSAEVISEGATLALALLSAYVAGLLADFENDENMPCAPVSKTARPQ